MSFDTGKETSEFNEAISFLNRINTIFYAILMSTLDNDMDSWFKSLSRLYQELVNDMDDKDKESLKVRLNELMNDINQHNIDYRKSGVQQIPQKLYWDLFNYESELRKIYNKAGYQTKRKDSASKALR